MCGAIHVFIQKKYVNVHENNNEQRKSNPFFVEFKPIKFNQ